MKLLLSNGRTQAVGDLAFPQIEQGSIYCRETATLNSARGKDISRSFFSFKQKEKQAQIGRER